MCTRKYARMLTVAATAGLLGAGQAFAQFPVVSVNATTPTGVPVVPDLIRASGEALANLGSALVDHEAARRAYIENTKLWHAAVVEHQQLIDARRREIGAQRRAIRERRDAMSENAGPKPKLSPAHYDRAIGVVKWPEALQADHYAYERAVLDKLLAEKSYTGDPRNDILIYDATTDLLAKLKTEVRVLPSFAYLDARKFLTLLADEARAEATESGTMIAAQPTETDSRVVSR